MRIMSRTVAGGMVIAASLVAAGRADAGGLLDVLLGDGRYGGRRTSSLLQNGQAVTGLTGQAGTRHSFQFRILPGTRSLVLRTAAGLGDCDLYLSREALPEPKSYEHRSNGGGTSESIVVNAPAPGTWHALVYGYQRFGGVSLTASWAGQASPNHGRGGIRIAGPAPGTPLQAGQSCWVQWVTSGHTRRVRILQSLDDGSTWAEIAPRAVAPAGAGRAPWTVPFGGRPGSVSAVRLKIVDVDRPLISATTGRILVRSTGPGRHRRPPRTRGSDPYEPNDRSSRASRIEAGTTQLHSVHGEEDEDWLMFVPPVTGVYRIAFTGVTVELKVRLYSARLGSSKEYKSRTFTVGRSGYALDLNVGPNARYFKLHVQARDDDDTGAYRVAVLGAGAPRPLRRPAR